MTRGALSVLLRERLQGNRAARGIIGDGFRSDWDEFLNAEYQPPVRRPVNCPWPPILVLFLYCAWIFWGTLKPATDRKDFGEVSSFVRKYLSLTSGCEHRFIRGQHSENWFVVSNRSSALQDEPASGETRFVLAGSRHRLAILRYSTKKQASWFEPKDVKSAQRLDFRFLTKPMHVSVTKDGDSLLFEEGDHHLYDLSIDLKRVKLVFAFNEQRRVARVTWNGQEELPLSALGKGSSNWVPVVWECGGVRVEENAVVDLLRCPDGTVAIQPPWTFWAEVGLRKWALLIRDPWTGGAFYLLLLGLVLAVARLKRSSISLSPATVLALLVALHSGTAMALFVWPDGSKSSTKEKSGPTRLGGVVQAFLSRTRGCTYTFLKKGYYPDQFWLIYSTRHPVVRTPLSKETIFALIGHHHSLSLVELEGPAPTLETCSTVESQGKLLLRRGFRENVWVRELDNTPPGWAEEREFCFEAGTRLEVANEHEGVPIENQDAVTLESEVDPSQTEPHSAEVREQARRTSWMKQMELGLSVLLQGLPFLLALFHMYRKVTRRRRLQVAEAFKTEGVARRSRY